MNFYFFNVSGICSSGYAGLIHFSIKVREGQKLRYHLRSSVIDINNEMLHVSLFPVIDINNGMLHVSLFPVIDINNGMLHVHVSLFPFKF